MSAKIFDLDGYRDEPMQLEIILHCKACGEDWLTVFSMRDPIVKNLRCPDCETIDNVVVSIDYFHDIPDDSEEEDW